MPRKTSNFLYGLNMAVMASKSKQNRVSKRSFWFFSASPSPSPRKRLIPSTSLDYTRSRCALHSLHSERERKRDKPLRASPVPSPLPKKGARHAFGFSLSICLSRAKPREVEGMERESEGEAKNGEACPRRCLWLRPGGGRAQHALPFQNTPSGPLGLVPLEKRGTGNEFCPPVVKGDRPEVRRRRTKGQGVYR